MITHLTNLSLMLQNDLPFQMMATFGTSPQIMAPLFNMLCVALLCLALTYLIYMVINTPLQRPFFNFQANNLFSGARTTPFYRQPTYYYETPQYPHIHMHTHGNPAIHSHSSQPNLFNPFRTTREIHQHSTQQLNPNSRTHRHA